MAGKRDLVETVYCEHCKNHFGSEASLIDHYRVNHPKFPLPYYEVKKPRNNFTITKNSERGFTKYNPYASKGGIHFIDVLAQETTSRGIVELIHPSPIPGKFIIVLKKGKKFVKWSKKG